MLRRVFLALGAVAIFLTASFAARAQSLRDAQITAIQLTIAETVLVTTSQLGGWAGSIKEISWSADVNERSWTLRMRGSAQQIEIGMGGFLWGGEADDWIVTNAGAGQIGGEPIEINGKLDWPIDRASSDRLKANFAQVTKFGKNSTYDWIVGTELIVGGTLGAVAGAAILTAPPLIIVVAGLVGALGGGSAAGTVSDMIHNRIESHQPPPPPAPPPAPSTGKGEQVSSKDGILFAVVTKEGEVRGSGPDAKNVLVGTAKGISMTGSVTQQ